MKQNRNTTPRKFPTMFEHYSNAVAETIALLARLDTEYFDLKKCVEWLDGNTIRPFQIGIPVGTPIAILQTPAPDNRSLYRAPWIEYGRIVERTEADADDWDLERGSLSRFYAVHFDEFWIGDSGAPESDGVHVCEPWQVLRILTEAQWNALLARGLPYTPRDFTAALLDAERGTKAKRGNAQNRPALRVIEKPSRAKASTRRNAQSAA